MERIRTLLQGEPPPIPQRHRPLGTLTVRSHLTIAAGVELVIDPEEAGLTPEQVRSLVKEVMAAFTGVMQTY